MARRPDIIPIRSVVVCDIPILCRKKRTVNDGVTHYENSDKYTYTVGNASKAYAIDKLDQTSGFVRSMLFLRGGDPLKKPVTVVFDRVQPLKALTATFLLHTANAPSLAPALDYLSDSRYKTRYATGDARTMTIRNKGGMATVQTLLPLNATVLRVGGNNNGNTCVQVYLSSNSSSTTADCRFTTRQRQSDGSYAWRNFSVGTVDKATDLNDVGAFRLEVSSPDTPLANQPQYFLNVISVGDDDGQGGVTVLDTATRLTADANTEAVLLNSQVIAVFNRGSTPAASLGWTAALASPQVIATGLKPGSTYVLNTTPVAGAWTFQLLETTDGSGNLHSSDQGVITVHY